jgi:hypothetical protein
MTRCRKWRFSCMIFEPGIRWRSVLSSLPLPLYTAERAPTTHWLLGWMCFWTTVQKNLFLCWESNPSCPACCYTELVQLLISIICENDASFCNWPECSLFFFMPPQGKLYAQFQYDSTQWHFYHRKCPVWGFFLLSSSCSCKWSLPALTYLPSPGISSSCFLIYASNSFLLKNVIFWDVTPCDL